MIYELRTYTLVPGKQGEYLHQCRAKLTLECARPK